MITIRPTILLLLLLQLKSFKKNFDSTNSDDLPKRVAKNFLVRCDSKFSQVRDLTPSNFWSPRVRQRKTLLYLLTSQLALSKPMGQRHLYASPIGTQYPPLRHGPALHGCCLQSSTLTPVIASVIRPTTLSLIVS